MSPLFIRIMLHFYSSPTPYVHPETPAKYPEAVMNIIEDAYFNRDLLTRDRGLRARYEDSAFFLTPRGEAYVKRLIETPLPRKAETWVFDEPEGDQ
jgi:hypothetical protein